MFFYKERSCTMNTSASKSNTPQEVIREYLQQNAAHSRLCITEVSTLHFLKARTLPQCQMHYITFQDREGRPWYFTCFLSLDDNQSWYVSSGSGSLHAPLYVDPPGMEHLPWLYLRNPHMQKAFLAGGEVVSKEGIDVAHVSLRSPNGIVLTDSVQDGLVLFWSNHRILFPLQAELFSPSSTLLSRQTVLTPPQFGEEGWQQLAAGLWSIE
ncbi:MAG TPA: hypothetical protein VEU97_04785 [Ktedonobacteraceae bacterium]|nr:hypothetical protein [Ktedonobacteraceae bacterium]